MSEILILQRKKNQASRLPTYHINKNKLYTGLFKKRGHCGLLMDKLIKSVNTSAVTKYSTYQSRN